MHNVTIGMPVWNGEKFLQEAIESILAQTYGDFALVISDNASTDSTGEICRAYVKHDARIRYVRQEKNIGSTLNHREVFQRSSGKYFKFAAHDDVLAPEFIHECVRVLDRDETVVLCSPATVLINEDGSPVRYSPEENGMVDSCGNIWPVVPEKNTMLASTDPSDRFAAVLLNMVMSVEIFGLIRRSALERSGLHPSCGSGDRVLLAELSLMGRYHLLEHPLFYRRCHAGQFTASASGSFREMWASGKQRSVFLGQLELLKEYTRVALTSGELTPMQRRRCLLAIWRRAVTRGKLLQRMFVALPPPRSKEVGGNGSMQAHSSSEGF
jgi:glycosyltransferase involved in cell wall biosynthesis